MKNTLIYICAFFLLVGCELDEQPKKIAEETFYNNANELESGVYAIYSQIQQGMRANIHSIAEGQADYGYARGSLAVLSTFQGLDNTNIGRMSDIYSRLYKGIRDANTVIKYGPKAMENSSVEVINELVSEARFLRSFIYLTMAKAFGGLPLRTENNMLEPSVPRTPIDEIYRYVLDELLEVENKLPDNPRKDQYGRPTKMAAKALIADILLHMEKWEDSKNKALEIINSGKHSLVQVSNVNDFDKIFGVTANGTSEELFYVKYTAAYGNELVNRGHYTQTIHFNNKGNNAFYTDSVKNLFVKEWDHRDLRKKFNFYNHNDDFGTNINVNGSRTTLFYKKFKDPNALANKRAATDLPIYRYADILLLYAEADARNSNQATAAAIDAVNQVRRRGYGLPSNQASIVDYRIEDYTSLESFLNLLVKERGYETLFEGKRYFDLKRMGKYASEIKRVHGIDIDPKILLYPIPLDEINYNDAISSDDQNPGY